MMSSPVERGIAGFGRTMVSPAVWLPTAWPPRRFYAARARAGAGAPIACPCRPVGKIEFRRHGALLIRTAEELVVLGLQGGHVPGLQGTRDTGLRPAEQLAEALLLRLHQDRRELARGRLLEIIVLHAPNVVLDRVGVELAETAGRPCRLRRSWPIIASESLYPPAHI